MQPPFFKRDISKIALLRCQKQSQVPFMYPAFMTSTSMKYIIHVLEHPCVRPSPQYPLAVHGEGEPASGGSILAEYSDFWIQNSFLGVSLELGAWGFGGSPFFAQSLRRKIPNQAIPRRSKPFPEKKDCLFFMGTPNQPRQKNGTGVNSRPLFRC
jgi:hypothetical protein